MTQEIHMTLRKHSQDNAPSAPRSRHYDSPYDFSMSSENGFKFTRYGWTTYQADSAEQIDKA